MRVNDMSDLICEPQPLINHSSINENSAEASPQQGNKNATTEVGTEQERLGTTPRHSEEPTRKSYAAAVAKPKYGRSIDASSLPTPGMQGEYPTICLIEEEVDIGIQYCLKSLVGRLDLVKMDLIKVKALVVEKWALSGECLVTPLGRGQQEAERAEGNRSEIDAAVEYDQQSQGVLKSSGRTQNHDQAELGTDTEEGVTVGEAIETNLLGVSDSPVHSTEMIKMQKDLNKEQSIEDENERHNMEMGENTKKEQSEPDDMNQQNTLEEHSLSLQALEDELKNILKEQEQDPFNAELHNQELENAIEIQVVKDVEIMTLRQKARVTEALEGGEKLNIFPRHNKDAIG
ncbi:hypothetical protein IFM89_006893 [Coptis chinensis]|uniref:Uncharacterized protein n=1 Tax=Coptis chinensis TaxID=261450 RepID=A0A835GV93_9MAGN|nr:hypothetical protein IFM89_006893 [Coptis chinensis]